MQTHKESINYNKIFFGGKWFRINLKLRTTHFNQIVHKKMFYLRRAKMNEHKLNIMHSVKSTHIITLCNNFRSKVLCCL